MNIHGSFTTEIEYAFQHPNGEGDTTTLKVRVKYIYYPFCPGARERRGLQIEPDTPAEVEITSVKDTMGHDVILDEDEQGVVEAQCFQDVADNEEAAAERRAEDRRELL